MYPVGSLYIETTGVNPATTFGFGTWAAYAAGLALVGVGTGTDSNEVEQTFVAATQVGEYKHTLAADEGSQPGFTTGTESATHTHTDSGHVHGASGDYLAFVAVIAGGPDGLGSNANIDTNMDFTGSGNANLGTESATHTHSVAAAAAADAHNTVQPSMPVYVWHRTA